MLKSEARVPTDEQEKHACRSCKHFAHTPTPLLRFTDMGPYRPTRRDFLLGAGGMLVLAPYGCGGGGSARGGGATRTITHALGETEVPVRPRRVAALSDTLVTLPLLDIGFRPVASAGLDGGIRSPGYDTSGIAFLGDENAPSIERIPEQEPDLIIGIEGLAGGEYYEELSRIAPTVMFSHSAGVDLFDFHRRMADVVNRGPEYEELLARVDRRTEELRGRLESILPDLEVSVLSAEGQDKLFYYGGRGSPYFVAFERLGLRFPDGMPGPYEEDGYQSLENISRFDADVLFILSGTYLKEPLADLRRQPIFRTLNAQEMGQVFTISYDDWLYSRVGGILAVYDDVERYLLGREIDLSGDFG